MENIYFLSVNDLKENSTIDLNVEDKIIKRSIIDGQNIDIQPIIGTRLYNSLKTKIVDNTLSGETDYKTLMDDYIQPCLLKYALRRSLLYIWVKLRNKSVSQETSDNSNPVESNVFDRLRRDASDDAEFYANKLKEYLCEEVDLFIEFKDYNPDSKLYFDKPNQSNSFFSGLQL